MSLESNIKEWVKIDDLINQYNNKIKILKDEKQRNEATIQRILNEKETIPTIKISDGFLKLTKQTVAQPLSFKYIESCLSNKYPKNDIDNIIAHIKENRTSKENIVLKRFYK